MAAGWGLSLPCLRSPYWILGGDGRTPVRVDQATRYAWVAAHPPDQPPVRVAYDEFPGGWVSTVFIGTDASGDAVPTLWETLITLDDADSGLPYLRWSTYDKAVAAHRATVEALQSPEFVDAIRAHYLVCEGGQDEVGP